jgi:vacuolar-type H+-ATPase subunit I/STV1
MNAFEQKRAARADRLRQRAERIGRLAEAGHERARAMASIIPFGQPVLVGHHSEGRDRRYRARIDSTFRKSFELAKEATDLERRADAAEANTAVSSDDPDAVAKLREKLAEEERQLVVLKDVNKLLRAGKVRQAVEALDFWPGDFAAKLHRVEIWKSVGHKTIPTTNASANIRRIKQRIEHLERVAAAPVKAAEVFGDVRVVEEENRVRVFFPGKPDEVVRSALKRAGFRWSPTVGAWQAYPSYHAWETARQVALRVATGAAAPT